MFVCLFICQTVTYNYMFCRNLHYSQETRLFRENDRSHRLQSNCTIAMQKYQKSKNTISLDTNITSDICPVFCSRRTSWPNRISFLRACFFSASRHGEVMEIKLTELNFLQNIFRIFLVWKINRMTSYCNWFMERPSKRAPDVNPNNIAIKSLMQLIKKYAFLA